MSFIYTSKQSASSINVGYKFSDNVEVILSTVNINNACINTAHAWAEYPIRRLNTIQLLKVKAGI